jgi:catechol 2,3-dioxygenase-like lactoylglutathione lyase family enzyme
MRENPFQEDIMPRDFPTAARLHIGLSVTSVERSLAFYRALFGAEPSKVRPGYAKLEPPDPSVNLSLSEHGDAAAAGARAHYGIELKSPAAVREAAARVRSAGLPVDEPHTETCCYAVQDKVWLTDPDGNAWELFAVEADAEVFRDERAASCCAGAEEKASCC